MSAPLTRNLLLLLGFILCSTQVTAATLTARQGQYFRVKVPRQWQLTENANALEVTAPDNVTGNVYTILLGGFGYVSPRQYLNRQLRQGPYRNVRVEALRDLPNQPGPAGIPWRLIEAQLTFIYRNVPVRAHVICAVAQGPNQYSAILRAYQAPIRIWRKAVPLLATVDRSITITNGGGIGGNFRQYLPKGISDDDMYGGYNRGYEQRQAPHDRLSQARREATMGQDRMKDPVTGEFYDMPLNAYDPTAGGYRNPKRPHELLKHAAPGE